MSFEFEQLPSVNTHYNKHWRQRSPATAEWRYEAREKAMQWRGLDPDDDLFFAQLDPVITSRALVVVWVYPPYEEISDVHNVHIKPLLDGFSDAGIWIDDEWVFVPVVIFAFGGVSEFKPREKKIRKTRIDIFELGMFTIRDMVMRLPKRRIRKKR